MLVHYFIELFSGNIHPIILFFTEKLEGMWMFCREWNKHQCYSCHLFLFQLVQLLKKQKKYANETLEYTKLNVRKAIFCYFCSPKDINFVLLKLFQLNKKYELVCAITTFFNCTGYILHYRYFLNRNL